MKRFADRRDAGRQLGARLVDAYRDEDLVVLGLARGGIPVAHEVARNLRCPLDLLVVRKIGVPLQPELAMGAIGEEGVMVVDAITVQRSGVTDEQFDLVAEKERRTLERRTRRYRGRIPRLPINDRVVIVVDDGLATGATALAACGVARVRGARRIIVAVPVSSDSAAQRIEDACDEFIAVARGVGPFAVGSWYDDFTQISDDEVLDDLLRARVDESTDHDS